MGKLTLTKIRKLKEPGKYGDGDGLMLRLHSPGKGQWTLRVVIFGKRHDVSLGSMEFMTLEEARREATLIRRDIANGLDPIAERKKAKLKIPTFKEAALLVMNEHKSTWKNPKHHLQWIRTLEIYAFPTIGDMRVKDIDGPIIRNLLSPIWLTKSVTARRVKQRIGIVLDWAYSNGFRDTEAPVRSVGRGLPRQKHKISHFSAMPYEDVPQFSRSLRQLNKCSRLALEFLILTATRSGEVRQAKWDEINFAERLWTIPPEHMKTGLEHIIPLTDTALEVLEAARYFHAPVSNFIFPGMNVKRPMSDGTLMIVLRNAGQPYTVHGFRSSFRDWVAEQTKYPGEVAEAALAHTVANRVEAAYRRTNYLEIRKNLMRDWEQFLYRGKQEKLGPI